MKKVPQLRDDDRPAQTPWPHPADGLDGDQEPAGAVDQLLAGKHDAGDLFVRLLTSCLPASSYGRRMGKAKHWEAGYHRLVATAYHLAPALFDGMTPKEVAAAIGVSWWAFRKQLRAVAAMQRTRDAFADRRRGNRPQL